MSVLTPGRTQAADARLEAETDATLVPFAGYLAMSSRDLAQPTHWRRGALEAGCRQLAHGERGTVALVPRGPAGRDGEVAPGLSMTVQIVRPGDVTSAHRHAFWHLYMVVDGQGIARVDAGWPQGWKAAAEGDAAGPPRAEYRIARGDVLYIPPWASHQLENPHADDALVLYAVQNLPQLAALGTLLREAPDGSLDYVYRRASTRSGIADSAARQAPHAV